MMKIFRKIGKEAKRKRGKRKKEGMG